MIHIGTPEFYRQVHEDALKHDAVLIEGVRSPIVQRITRSYRWIIDSKRFGLVVQPKFPAVEGGGLRVVHADLSHEEFAKEWRRIPLYLRLLLNVLAPCYGLYQRWFATLDSLARGHSLEDVTGRDEALSWTPQLGKILGALLEARDARLISKLSDLLDAPIEELRSIAVVYGARHMRAILRELVRRHDYVATDTRWLDVF